MSKVINLRGTNGSGKSFLIRKWMQFQQAVPYPRREGLLGGSVSCSSPEYYKLRDGGWLVGDYRGAIGGCDRIHTQEEVERRIRQGIIVSTLFQRWYVFSRSVGGMVWVYLDTPLEVCLKRILDRNQNTPFNEQLVRDKVKSIDSTRLKAVAAGERIVVLHWENAWEEFQVLMCSV
jgi:hypothetical protein